MEGAATFCLIMANLNTTDSESYIRVDCYGDADPKYNRLQLRTDPPTFISLNPGSNYLTIEDYPALKFGFKQIDNPEIEEHTNCEDVREMDFSNYDGSYLSTLDYMFYKMPLEWLTFGNMKTPNLKSAKMAFAEIGREDKNGHIDIDLSNFDFSKLECADFMFQGANLGVLKLNNAHFASLVRARKFIRHSRIKSLELNGLEINNPEVLDIHIYTPVTVSLKNVELSTMEKIINGIESKRILNGDSTPASYILDENLSVDVKLVNDVVQCSFSTIAELTALELLNRINSYLNGVPQETPEIIWFDNKRYDDLKPHTVGYTPDYLGLAEALSQGSEWITMDDMVGKACGLHFTKNRNDGAITLWYPEQLFHFNEGKIREKIVIIRCLSDEAGLNAVKLGKYIRKFSGMAVVIFMPYFRKERIPAAFGDYNQYRLIDCCAE